MKISCHEPAERPFTVALSHAEVVALAKYHVSQARGIPKRLGSASMELLTMSPLNGRGVKRLHDVAKQQLEAHAQRTEQLMKILSAGSPSVSSVKSVVKNSA